MRITYVQHIFHCDLTSRMTNHFSFLKFVPKYSACDGKTFFRDVTRFCCCCCSFLNRFITLQYFFGAHFSHEFNLSSGLLIFSDISRLDKSPLLANGYNAPPTHLSHMPFMQMGHHGASMMSPGMPPHIRPDAAMLKNHQNIPGMEAITR